MYVVVVWYISYVVSANFVQQKYKIVIIFTENVSTGTELISIQSRSPVTTIQVRKIRWNMSFNCGGGQFLEN